MNFRSVENIFLTYVESAWKPCLSISFAISLHFQCNVSLLEVVLYKYSRVLCFHQTNTHMLLEDCWKLLEFLPQSLFPQGDFK